MAVVSSKSGASLNLYNISKTTGKPPSLVHYTPLDLAAASLPISAPLLVPFRPPPPSLSPRAVLCSIQRDARVCAHESTRERAEEWGARGYRQVRSDTAHGLAVFGGGGAGWKAAWLFHLDLPAPVAAPPGPINRVRAPLRAPPESGQDCNP